MATEKYLILGSGSFYGASFAKHVAAKGEEVYGLDRKRFNISTLTAGKPKEYDFDGYDYIVNFISKSLVVESWDKPQWWYQTNTTATGMLFDQISKRKPKRLKKFIHVSTPEVYGSAVRYDGATGTYTPWVYENQPFAPTTPYAISRAAADFAAMAYHKAYGFPVLITRTANIYGKGQQPYRFIPAAFATLGKKKPLTLHGQGETRRSWIHVSDACEATYLLCKEGGVGQTYHISTQADHTVREVADLILQQLGLGTDMLRFGPDRLGKDLVYLLNSDKLRELGWTDKIGLIDGLKDYANRN